MGNLRHHSCGCDFCLSLFLSLSGGREQQAWSLPLWELFFKLLRALKYADYGFRGDEDDP